MGMEFSGKDAKDPLAGRGEELDAGAMESLGHEVATEQAPKGAVRSRGDVVLVAAEETGSRERSGAVGEGGAVLDEGLVGEAAVGDEDGGAGADAEGDNGAIAGVEVAEEGLDVGEGAAEPEEIPQNWDGGRAWRELLLVSFAEEEVDDRTYGEGEEN